VLLIDEPVTSLNAVTASQVLAAARQRLSQAVLILAMHKLPADAVESHASQTRFRGRMAICCPSHAHPREERVIVRPPRSPSRNPDRRTACRSC